MQSPPPMALKLLGQRFLNFASLYVMDEWVINQPLAAAAQEQILSVLFPVWLLLVWEVSIPQSRCAYTVRVSQKEKTNPTLPSFPDGKVETLEILLLNIPPGWTWSKSWEVMKDAWRELRHWGRREKQARKIIYFNGDFCKGFIFGGDRTFEWACGKCKRSICSLLESCVGIAEGTQHIHFSFWRWQGEHEGWEQREWFAVGCFGKGRRLLSSSKGFI